MSMVVFSIRRRFEFVKSSKTFADGLWEEVRNLENESERVAILAVVARNNLRNFYDLFSEWEASADKALKEARDLLDRFEAARVTCCRGFLPDPHIRYRFKKKAKGKIEEIRQLAHKCSGFRELDDISFVAPALGRVAAPIPSRREGKDVSQSITVTASASSALASTKLKDTVFKSRAVMIRKIMHALAKNSNIVVGVYGMGGVGKSTLLVDVDRKIRQKKKFDLVAMAGVSENPDIKRIQGEIAHCLGLDIKNEESVSVRAQLLCERLEPQGKKKKVLIILDNLWERLDLKSVGIPCGHDNKVIGCKLLLTSRDRDVLRREMGCDTDFHLGGLKKDEAKKLFKRMVGDRVRDDAFKPLVDEALHKCAGLPFLIVSMATYCKGASLSEWKDALRQIERPEDKGIDEVMNNMLQLSYDHLEVKEAKSLLQQCVVNGVSRPSIRDLAMYGMHLGLLQENDSMEEPIERFRLLIFSLQTSFLLLRNGDGDDFKVHDSVRKFVASVALGDLRHLTLKDKGKSVTGLPKDKLKSYRAEEPERCSSDSESSPVGCSRKVLMCGDLGLTEPPEATQWQSFTEIYLMENQLAVLPENPRCPGLLVLFLNRNCKLRTISQNFFDFMPALEILNLSRTPIKSLPESLFRLSCLKRLFLNHCVLLRVLPPQIGELKQLEVLDLEGTEIMDLPKEVAKLTKLTCLEVSFCLCTNCGTNSAEANALIPQGTISALSQLEELSIDVHPEDEGWENVVEAIIDDVCGLMRLDTLKLYFPRVEHLRKWFGTSEVSRSLSHFKFVIGKHAERIMCYLPEDLEFEFEHWDRSLKYVNGVGVPIDIQKMLQHTTAFFLDRHRDVAKLSDFGIENMEQLKCCIIGECNEIKVIVDGTDVYDEADRSEIVLETREDGRRFLGSLEYLYIYRMKSLSCIYEGPLHRGSFSRLKCLALLTCPQLTSIFTPGLLENLDSLEELNVEDCPLVLSLVRCKDTSIYASTCFLPKLNKISLVSLPGLISIYSGLCIAPNLKRWSIIGCPNLESPSADEICRGHLTEPRGTFDKSCQFEPPHQAEELERSSIEIESSPPEYSRKVLMCRGLGLTEPPEATRWQSFTEIYLMENELAELPKNPRCPGLLVLFLNRNCKLRTISPPFFDFMPALEILNLSRTWIKSLPESLFRLSRLKRLYLNHCELLRVLPPKIGELQQLEVLDLEGTEIMDLPKEVAKLTKLTCLEVSFCPRTNCGTKSAEASALIPPGTISALSQLEELSIDTHPEDERWESVVEAIVDDVCGLVRLDTLELYFPQVEHLRKWLGTSKVSRSLSHFKFVVGKHAERIMYYLPEDLEFELEHWDRSLKYVNGVGVPIDIQNMLLQTTAFFLDHHRDVTKLSDFGIENMEQLRCCIIGECDEIEVIVDGTDVYDEADRNEIVLETREDDRSFLGSLEYLYVYRMKSLLSIYVGPLHRGSLSRLKCLALLTCPRLTSLFTPGLMENLGSLEELHVEDCPLLLNLVRCEDTHIYESTNFLPKLKKISLVSLPELISISNGLRIAPNLERLSIMGCPNLKSPSADESCRSHLTGPRVMVEAAASASAFEKVASTIAAEAYKDLRGIFGDISKKIDYADDLKVNFGKMTDQAKMLCARRHDVEAEINKNKTKRVSKECEAWINRVKVAEQEVLKLESKYEKEIVHAWRYARLWSRANLSKHMAKKREELRVLLEEGKLDNGVVAERSPEHVRVIDTCGIEDKPSLNWALKEILDNLRERKIKRIGLWGMVGTGKTTVMQNLNNDEEVKKMFDIVIWVSVSKAWSVEKVQDAITQCLKLRLEGGVNAVETAQLISNELGGMRYLLLLDEVWDPFDLHKIGIPNNDNDSKVVFASRFRDLCYDMDADHLVNMKRLSDADAYKMFEEKVGRSMTNPSVIPVAKLVVRECAGLPLLIDKVARVFRGKDNIHLWKDGLKRLQRWPRIKIQGMDEVLEFLKFCYEDLDGEDKRACFLYGALFPEDRDIFVDYLMECWKAEGFLGSIDEFQDARDRGHSILHDLINASLLERSAMKTHVRMNRIVRKMALKILSGVSDHKILARPCEGLKEPPKEEEWTSASRISLMDNDLCSLPATSNCTNLLTLLLQRNKNLMMIPESFFLSMQRLRVLDLHATAITSLPPSLPCLTHLRALYLNSCKGLIELPSSLEALVHLEVLDIRHTGIISLPIQVGSLPQMRCLRMSLSNFGAGNPKVISSISLLEELMIDVDPNTLWSDQVMRTITEEVSTLTRLTSLTFSFPKVEFLEIFVRSSPLWKDLRFTFQFSVGICNSVKHHILDYFEHQSCKCLKYANDEGAHPVISEVLTETEVFELIDHKNILSLSAFGTENLSKLRACSVEGCEDIICIIDGNVAPPCAFEWLERMVINRAPNLHCIWKGPVPVGSLGQMTSLTLYNCPKLKKIFSYGLIQQLSELKHLSVEECHEIEEIIIETKNSCLDPRTLPSLTKLVVHDLPKLRSIAPNDTLIWPSLERLDIVSCPSLLKLPFTGINAINLRSIVAEQSWWSTLVWQDDAIEERLRSFCSFI